MHIVIVHQYFLHKGQGGGSRVNQLVKFWSEKGHKITVICGMVDMASGEKFKEYKGKIFAKEKYGNNINLIRCHVSPAYNINFIGRLWAYFSFTCFSTLAGIFIRKGDILLTTSPPLTVAITGRIISMLKKMPWIFEVRDLWPESAIDTGVLNNKILIRISYYIEKMAYKKSRLINVLTPAFKKVLIESKGIDENKIIEIPNGADLDIINPGEKNNWVREQYGLQDKFVIVYLGAHGVANKLSQILDAAQLLKEYEDIVFMLIGTGMEKNKLVDRAKQESINNVIFIEPQSKEKIVDFCRAADVGTAVLQKNDTFKTVYPNKVFDYMSCKKPIILAIDGVARKLIEDANSGLFVEPENPNEFYNAVLRLYSNRELLDQYGENGYQFVTENFSREILANKYLDAIEGINNANN